MKRQLAAILYADVAGYSRLTGLDEEATHQKLDAGLNLLTDVIADRGGRKIHEAGDAILAEFQSATDAVDSAVEFQLQMSARNEGLAEDERLAFRIGVHLGEVIHDRDDIYGDGVNLAARIQELAEPGGVCISGTVYEQVEGQVKQSFEDLGYRKFKNISQSIHVYRTRLSGGNELHPMQAIMARGAGMPMYDDELDKTPVVTGRCLCGQVTFEITEPAIGTGCCHCRMCQRALGAPMNAWGAFRREAVRFTNRKPKIYRSSLINSRGFCGNCGTSFPSGTNKILAFPTATLDNPEDFAPTWHAGIESQMPWLDIHDTLPRTQCEESPGLRKAWESVDVPDPADWKELPYTAVITKKAPERY